MSRIYLLWLRYRQPQSGQGMAEYALIIGLVAVAAITAWTTLGGDIKTAINNIAGCI